MAEDEIFHRHVLETLAHADAVLSNMTALLEKQQFHEDCWKLKDDKGFIRACSRFTGTSEYGWTVACGPDGRCRKLVKMMGGWDRFYKLVKACRKFYL